MSHKPSRKAPRPITILTGFLGAGKTTLLSRILADPAFRDTAVVINEFGDVALDHALIADADESLIETTAGCLCCTVQGDVRDTVVRLLDRADAGEIPTFERLVIETTGLADPGPVIQTLFQEPRLDGRAALAGVATVVDAIHGDDTLDRHDEARRQVAVADLILLSKTEAAQDPASRRDVDRLAARLAAMNPRARRVDAADVGPTDLFDLLFDLGPLGDPAGAGLTRWLGDAGVAAAHAHDHHNHDHAHHHHHGDDIVSRTLRFDGPLDARAFWFALELLRAQRGENLLRVKGLIALDDAPDQPVLLHGVQHVFDAPIRLDAWPSAVPEGERGGRLVVIARGLDEHALDQALAGVLAAAHSPEADVLRLLGGSG